MPLWFIHPHDSIIVRDGRPFSNDGGARANSLPFVTPSVVAGALRQRIGSNQDGKFVCENLEQLKKENLRGPLLAELSDRGHEYWVPMPADSLVMTDENNKSSLMPLVPLEKYAGVTNLPDFPDHNLSPIGLQKPDRRKPSSRAYMRWSAFEKWLIDPHSAHVDLQRDTMSELPYDTRVHVAIDPKTRTVGEDEGRLFSTKGIEFRTRIGKYGLSDPVLSNIRQFAVVVESASNNVGMPPAVMTMGGERRLVRWEEKNETLPDIKEDVIKRIVATKCCRVVVLTPALFTNGWLPTKILKPSNNVEPQLVGASIPRGVVLSGWEMLGGGRGQPKPSKRYVPAGSVYFIRLKGENINEKDVREWIKSIWMQNNSDDEQSCNDGFGLAVVGTWKEENHGA
jgi:CRISPR-associated protein Cmr3